MGVECYERYKNDRNDFFSDISDSYRFSNDVRSDDCSDDKQPSTTDWCCVWHSDFSFDWKVHAKKINISTNTILRRLEK